MWLTRRSGGQVTGRDCKAALGQEAQGKLSAKAEPAPKKQGPGRHVLDFAPLHPIAAQHSFPILLEKKHPVYFGGRLPRLLHWDQPWGSCPPSCPVRPHPVESPDPSVAWPITQSLGTGFWAKGCREGGRGQSPSHPEDTVSLPLPVDSTFQRFLGPAPPQPVLRPFHQSPEQFCAYKHC